VQAVEDTLGSNVEVNGIVAIDWEDWNPDGNSPDNTGSDPTTLEQRSFGEGTTPTVQACPFKSRQRKFATQSATADSHCD